jgi:hypothetical protein
MFLVEEMQTTTGARKLIRSRVTHEEKGQMESRKHCAYNQTRECFLSLEVEIANLSNETLEHRVATLDLKSGEGLWITPFRGIPTEGIRVPLDLVYLDEDCRVLGIVESFPSFRTHISTSRVAGVLLLPSHSIYSSQTQLGDQLLICAAGDMERRLERCHHPGDVTGVVQSALLFSERSPGGGEDAPREGGTYSRIDKPASPEIQEMGRIAAKANHFKTPKNWLQRFLSPDPRRAPREEVSNLAAYYWTNEAPQAHKIRDISSTGFYLVTEERWYPGTLLLMTLQVADFKQDKAEGALSIYSKVVRWGDDGVGLQFVLQDAKGSPSGQSSTEIGMTRKELDLFLQRLGKYKS